MKNKLLVVSLIKDAITPSDVIFTVKKKARNEKFNIDRYKKDAIAQSDGIFFLYYLN